MTDRPDVSVIIVNHHADRILDKCVGAVSAGEGGPSREIIIIDNPAVSTPSPELSCEVLLTRIPVKNVIGFGAACNLGASRAQGEYFLFLNPDVVVGSEAVQQLFQALSGHPSAGIAIGRLSGPNGDIHATCRRFPTPANLLFSHGSMLYRLFGARRGDYMLPDYESVTSVDWGTAALMMISKRWFETLSGFDESFFMYLEDTDLCYRLNQAGGDVVYVPQARGVHLWGYSTRLYRFRRILWHHRSLWRYFVKHHRTVPRLAALSILLPANCLLSLLAELFTLRP